MNRAFLGAGALALALAIVAPACSEARPNAATINGTTIERRAFEDELRLYADNTAWTSQQQTPVQGEGKGTVTMDFTDNLLRRKIALELIRQENQRRGVTITPDIQQQAEQLAPQFTLSLQDPALTTAWTAFPESFQKQSVEETAQYLALSTALGGGTLDDAALQKIYDENPARFSQACIRHILVATEQEAKDLKAQLDGGADFSQLAKDHSTDGSATDGGRLYTEGQPCPVAASTYDGDFVDGAFSVPTGTVSAPVHTQFGWHLIVVDKTTPVPFEQSKDAVQQYAAQRSNSALSKVLTEGAKGDISVNQRYGRWDAGGAQIIPPGSATSTTVTSTATTAPAG